MAVKEVLNEAAGKMKKTIDVVNREFSSIRTSRASTTLVDGIKVEYYGTPTPIKQLATISTPEPKLIVINAWDKSVMGAIEKAILKSDVGITPTNDGKLIRLGIPQLTGERREELCKVIGRIAEDGRVSLRSIRHAANDKIKKMLDASEISKDESFWGKDDIQKLIDKYTKNIDEILAHKEKEIKEI
ncbi:MAG: ribosome recycling factor [Candidatus Omnitrophica bacterium]|nr:ribosome recycling factor [Candidatus Omnitrophota bacterium]